MGKGKRKNLSTNPGSPKKKVKSKKKKGKRKNLSTNPGKPKKK